MKTRMEHGHIHFCEWTVAENIDFWSCCIHIHRALQGRHMASQITGKWTVQHLLPATIQVTINYWYIVMTIHLWPAAYPNKWPVVRETFSCHDIVMDYTDPISAMGTINACCRNILDMPLSLYEMRHKHFMSVKHATSINWPQKLSDEVHHKCLTFISNRYFFFVSMYKVEA